MPVHRKQPRSYALGRRAETQAETRQRIVEATVELHGSIGPVRTTISAIAEKAAVQRLTVYRHFPDERSLLEACSSHARAVMPAPDVMAWRAIADPEERVGTALTELYAYFRRTKRYWVNVLRDAEVSPLVEEMAAKRRFGYLALVRDTLAEGWGRRNAKLIAVLGHAVDFRTWESLTVRQGLDDAEAREMMLAFVRCTRSRSGSTPKKSHSASGVRGKVAPSPRRTPSVAKAGSSGKIPGRPPRP